MDAAVEQAEKSWAEGGIPIGSVLADRAGNIVARGHNERFQSGDSTAHAEVVCIRHAGRRRDWRQLTLVSTHSPCVMCSGTTALHNIPRVLVGQHLVKHTDPVIREICSLGEEVLRKRSIEIVVLDDPRCAAMLERAQNERPDLLNEDVGE